MTLLVGPGLSPARAAELLFQAEAQTLAGACTGQPVRLEGNHNTVALRGPCGSLLVKGVANTVELTIAGGGLIHVEGSDNRVRYVAAGAAPVVETLGPNNEVTADSLKRPISAPAAPPPAAALVAVAKPAPMNGPVALSGDDQERLADCGGRDVVVTGSRSAYVIRGACHGLTVRGDLLTVQAVVQPGARISVTGRGSVVSWTLPGKGRPPGTVVRGLGSRVQRAEAIGGEALR